MTLHLCLVCMYRISKLEPSYCYYNEHARRIYKPPSTSWICTKHDRYIHKVKEECKDFVGMRQTQLFGGKTLGMSVFDEMDKVKTQTLSSDLPDKITATVIKASKVVKTGKYEGTPMLQLALKLKDGTETSTNYRIPKAWTGKGQMDILIDSLKKLKVELKAIEGKTFEWERKELEGSVKGNARHYPVKLVK